MGAATTLAPRQPSSKFTYYSVSSLCQGRRRQSIMQIEEATGISAATAETLRHTEAMRQLRERFGCDEITILRIEN